MINFAHRDDELAFLVTQRKQGLFVQDLEEHSEQIRKSLNNKRVLVIGGAGSIGSATVKEIARFETSALHIIDINENNLAELVRDLRSSTDRFALNDFRTLPVDFGSPIMHRFILEQPPYDYVLNFAALKHVRNEKDTYSLQQMFETNILKPKKLFAWLAAKERSLSYFCVSTDKAANPVNLMGASKRLMEHIIFSKETTARVFTKVTSSRFANVAFSDGSLLYSWLRRLAKKQPLAVPEGTRRYFLSSQESGEICLLASTCTPTNHILIPRLEPDKDLQDLVSIAKSFLKFHGYEPHFCKTESEAKESLKSDIPRGKYPIVLTPLDTTGEKPEEEFVGVGEKTVEIGMRNLLTIEYVPPKMGNLVELLDQLEHCISAPSRPIQKQDLIALVSRVVSELCHADREKGLDDRM